MARDIDIVIKVQNQANQAFQQLQRQLDGVARSTQTTGQAARQAQGPMSGMGVALDNVNIKSLAAAAGLAGIGMTAMNTGRQMVRTAIDFESAMAGVAKTVDATESEFAAIERGIRNMSMSMPMTASEIAGIAEAAGQLGIQTGAILEFTRTMADLGVATNMTSEQAATALARLANITGMAQDDFDNLGSTIVDLGNNLATTESEIVDMGLRIAAAGSQIGLAESEILSFAGALSSLGVEAEAGGTAVSRVMIDIANAVAVGGEKLAAFADVAGMSTDQFRTLFQDDAAAAIITFVEGLNQVSESGGNVFAVLEELGLADIRVRDSLLRMAGGGDILRESLELGNQAWDENIALTTEAEQRYQTTASQLQLIRNRLDDVAYSLFAAGDATGGTSIALEGLSANAEGIANVARSIEWVADAASSVPSVLPDWLQPDGGSGRIAAGWDSVGQSIRNAATVAAGGPLALAGVDWFPAGEDAGETFTMGFESGLSGFGDAVRNALSEIQLDQPFTVGAAGYGPFLEEIFVEPILALQPQVREELKSIFEMSPDVGATFAASIAAIVGEGEMSMAEGMDTLSTIPSDVLNPAMERLRSDLQGQLAEALLSGEDTNHIREQLTFVQSLMGETAEFVASSAIGFTEFGTAGEMAMADVATAADALQGALDGLAGAYQIGLDVQQQFTGQASEYASGQKNIEDALEAVQRKQEEGIELSEEELKLLDLGEDAIGRYVGGQEDATVQAGLAAIANAELMKAQDDLNRAIADGETDLEPYLDRVKDAEQFARDMGLATDDNTSAQDDFFNAVTDVITKLGELIDKLDGVPEKITTEIELNTASAIANYDGFLQYLRDNPGQSDLYVNQITNQGYTENNERGGPINKDTLSWVGEAGPELVLLPKGAHVYPHEESMGMANRLGIPGYASGTPDRPQLTDGEQQAIKILGEMDVVITPESMAQADAELAAMLDAREMAVELGLGDAIVAQLDEDIAAKQGEIDLIGRIAGSAYGQGFLDELAQVDATEAMAGLLSDFSLEDIVSGQAGTDLGQQFVDLLQLEKIATEMGDLDLAAQYREQADAVAAELERLGQVSGTAYVQGQIDAYNAEQVAAEWDARLSDALAGPEFGQNIQSSIDEMNEKIDLGILMGAPMDVIEGWQAERDALVAEGEAYWSDVVQGIAAGAFSPEEIAAFAEAGGDAFMDAMGETFSPEAIEHILNPINQIADAGFEALMDMFGDAPELAEGFIDDIVAGLHDGTFDYEQAMALLGQAGSDALIPGLERIEEQLTVDLVEAILAGNAELEADILEKLKLLEQLQGELDLTTEAAERYARGSSGIYYNPNTTGMGGSGSGGSGGGLGGGGGSGNVQPGSVSGAGFTGFNADYEFNHGPDSYLAQLNPEGYELTKAAATLMQKYGIDLSYSGGTFSTTAAYAKYIADRVRDHVERNPWLAGEQEFWRYVNEVSYGMLSREMITGAGSLTVEDGGSSLVYNAPASGGTRAMGVRGFADGGIITSPLLAMIGENSKPEMVQPLAQGHPERDRLIADIASAVIQSTGGATFVVDGNVFHEAVGKRAMHSINGRVR